MITEIELLQAERMALVQRVKELEERMSSQLNIDAHARMSLPVPNPVTPMTQATSYGPRYTKPIIVPDKFDGSTPLDPYEKHFRLCSRINGWDENAMAHFLAVSLRGRAQQVLAVLAPHQLGCFSEMLRVLKSRFDPEGKDELYRIQLRNRRQGPKESLTDLAQDIRTMVDRAYPEMNEASKDGLAKQSFLDALPDSELRIRVLQMRPSTLQKAVQDTIELEAISKAERERSCPSRSPHPQTQRVRAVTESPDTDTHVCAARVERPDTHVMSDISKSIQKLNSDLASHAAAITELRNNQETQAQLLNESIRSTKELIQEVRKTAVPVEPPRRSTDRNLPRSARPHTRSSYDNPNTRCFACHQFGHIRPNCPNVRTEN
jgi:hypothetical protein